MEHILDDYIFENYVVIGVSSGPDSMCLLDILEKKTNKIIVCHINHNVRKESKIEETYLKKYCQEHNLIFETMTIKNYEENNFENEARKKRYSFYENIINKYNSKYLLLAHHGDDLIETILMKIVRGSNIEGYAGIKRINNKKNYQILRPLLPYNKEDILEYNRSHNITYFIDSSNTNTKYTRNRYRKNILPLLKEEDPQIQKKFLKYSQTLEEYDNYIKKLVEKNLDTIYKNNIIHLKELKKLDPFILKNTLYHIMNKIYLNQSNIITDKHITNIISLINNPKPNLTLNLPQKKIIVKEYDKMFITNKSNKEKQNYKIQFHNKIKINNLTIEKTDNEEKDNNEVCRIKTNDIKLPLYIRNRKDGDFIILNGNKRKKIKEIFIEKKIPISIRNSYPLLVDSNDNIIWIPNIKKSKFCIKKEENYDIIIRCK